MTAVTCSAARVPLRERSRDTGEVKSGERATPSASAARVLRVYPQFMRAVWVVTVAVMASVGVFGSLPGPRTSPVFTAAAIVMAAVAVWGSARWPASAGTLIFPGMAVAGVAVWVWLLAEGGEANAGFALLAPFTFALSARKVAWPWILAGGVVLVGGIAAVAVLGAIPLERLLDRAVVPTATILAIEVIGFLALAITWDFFSRWEEDKSREREYALVQERLRFANDLHDLQGHSLLAVKFKIELARRSLDRDIERARAELESVEALVSDLEAQTRQLANGFRDIDLVTELQNLKELLVAAGVHARVDGTVATLHEWEPEYAAFLREAASNILRHSTARRVDILVAANTLTISNDGALSAPKELGAGHGLLGLRDRLTPLGAHLTWDQNGEMFTIAVTRSEADDQLTRKDRHA